MEVLEPSQKVDAADVATTVSVYSDYQIWSTYYGGDEYEDEGLEGFEEEAKDREEKEEDEEDEEDADMDLMAQYRKKTAEVFVARDAEKKDKLRELISMIEEKDGSEETLITPEEKSVASAESSRESSTHPCLLDIDISDSQLKLNNLYTMCPIPDDPGLVPAFWTTQEPLVAYPDDGVKKFFDLTRTLKVQPIRAVESMLLSGDINLKYYGLNSRVVRPLCDALMDNPWVHTIDLAENWLSEDACYHLNDFLLRNNYVNALLLRGCRIGPRGAARLRQGITKSKSLITLDLSACDIGREGLEHITEAVCANESLESLALNNNHLDESCADALQTLVSCSQTLAKLELTWNSLYTAETWKRFGRRLAEAERGPVDLDLSWNALGRECVPYLRQLLSRSQSLLKLRLTGNRFYNEDAVMIARGLSGNEVLRELYLGNNPLKGDGARVLVQAVTPDKSPNSQLQVLDLTNVWANTDILPALEAIERDRPELDVRLGGILSNYKIKGPDVMAILLKRANYEAMKVKNKRRRRNFGHFVLSLADNLISKGKFTELVKQFGMKLSESLLSEIMIAFAGERKTVNQELLKSIYMTQYPDTKPPPEKPPKKKKGKAKKSKKEKGKGKKKK